MTDILEETQNLLNQLKSLPPRSKPLYADTAKALMQTQDTQTPVTQTPVTKVTEPTTAQALPNDNPTPVPFELWETLAYDLALENTDPDTIVSAYKITSEQLDQLQNNPYFTKILQAKKDEVKQLGADAAFTVKMRMVANRATPQLLRRLIDPNTANRDFLAMFKTVTELGQLIPEPIQDKTPTFVGASFTLNLGGVPGLEHLAVETTNQTDEVTDADWQEVVSHKTDKLYDELGEL